MKLFDGFPARMEFTPIPNPFLSRLMPYIDDIAELKTVLYIFMSIYGKKSYPRFVSRSELLANASLVQSLGQDAKKGQKTLDDALQSSIKRGIILHLAVEKDGKAEDIYCLNTPSDRQALAKIQNGDLKLPEIEVKAISPAGAEEAPNIFALYEDNIGMLTPLIADELKAAEKLYPPGWISEAFKIAVNRNIRKWDYISAILERWNREGKDDGTHRRDTKKEDPDKYINGKYGHMVQR